MPSTKRDERTKAEQIYRESNGSIKLVDIAEQLGVSPSKIRKWKSLDGWDKQAQIAPGTTKKKVERSTSRKGNAPPDDAPPPPKKSGAPKGNKNAVGNNGGAPLGNQNALIHGGYSAVYWDTLDDEEREMIESVPVDEEAILLDQIKLFYARERRIMAAISRYRNSTSPLAVSGVRSAHTKREFDNQAERERYEALRQAKMDEEKISYFGYEKSTFTDTEATINIVQRLERELSTVQRAKTQCTEALNKIRKSREESESNSMAEAWIAALTGGDDDE